MNQDPRDYSDILFASRPVSRSHPPMPRKDRAAQFAPFAALTGYEDALREAARPTSSRIELDEDEKEELDRTLSFLFSQLSAQGVSQRVRVTFFLPDQKKAGGSYVTVSGILRKFHSDSRLLVLEEAEGTRHSIPVADVLRLELLSG